MELPQKPSTRKDDFGLIFVLGGGTTHVVVFHCFRVSDGSLACETSAECRRELSVPVILAVPAKLHLNFMPCYSLSIQQLTHEDPLKILRCVMTISTFFLE